MQAFSGDVIALGSVSVGLEPGPRLHVSGKTPNTGDGEIYVTRR